LFVACVAVVSCSHSFFARLGSTVSNEFLEDSIDGKVKEDHKACPGAEENNAHLVSGTFFIGDIVGYSEEPSDQQESDAPRGELKHHLVPKKENADCGNPTHQSEYNSEARAITVAFPTRCGFPLELWTTFTQSFIKFPGRFKSS
jgi:hypothetical protein